MAIDVRNIAVVNAEWDFTHLEETKRKIQDGANYTRMFCEHYGCTMCNQDDFGISGGITFDDPHQETLFLLRHTVKHAKD